MAICTSVGASPCPVPVTFCSQFCLAEEVRQLAHKQFTETLANPLVAYSIFIPKKFSLFFLSKSLLKVPPSRFNMMTSRTCVISNLRPLYSKKRHTNHIYPSYLYSGRKSKQTHEAVNCINVNVFHSLKHQT